MVVLNINGIAYNYPETDDEDWGDIATVAMQKMALLTATFRNPTLPAATIGQIRLGNTDSIAWRTFANDKNIRLYVSTDDLLYYQKGSDTPINLLAVAALVGPGSSTDNAITRWDGSGGAAVQNSVAILSDAGALSGLTTISTSGDVTVGAHLKVTGNQINGSGSSVLALATDNGTVSLGGPGGSHDASLELSGNNPGIAFGASDWVAEELGFHNDFSISGGTGVALTLRYASNTIDFGGAALSAVGATLLPDVDATSDLGSTTKNFARLFLDRGATDGGAINFNAGGSSLSSSADGQALIIGGSFVNIEPATDGAGSLGTPSNRWGKLVLATISPGTPTANTLYKDMIPKAYGAATSGGTLSNGGNINSSVTHGSTGVYDYTFLTNMASSNYVVVATSALGNTVASAPSANRTASGFRIQINDPSASGSPAINAAHTFFIIGTQ